MTAPIAPVLPGASNAPISNAVAGGQMGKDEFLKLLVAQMTHQDPLNPMDGQEMASQLAQFSSVEQLMNLGQKFDTQTASLDAMLGVVNNTAAVGLIGHTVMVADGLVAAGPDGTREGSVIVPSGGGNATLTIQDLDGNTVRTVDLGALTEGETPLDIAGALDGLPAGSYRVAVELEAGDERISLQPRIAVPVDGVRLSATGAFITSGSLSYPIGLIDAIQAGSTTS